MGTQTMSLGGSVDDLNEPQGAEHEDARPTGAQAEPTAAPASEETPRSEPAMDPGPGGAEPDTGTSAVDPHSSAAAELEETAPAEPEGEQEAGQQTLEMGAAEAAVPAPEAAAAVAVAESTTHVATYGDQDLDEMVAQLKTSAPEVEEEEGAAAAQDEPVKDTRKLTLTWPFLAYVGVWIVFAGAFTYLMRAPAAAGDIMAWPYYRYFVWGGIGLAVLGLVLILGVWLFARSRREPGDRAGQFTSALLKGSIAIFVGVALWWVAFYAAVALARV